MEYKNFDQIVQKARDLAHTARVAVASAAHEHVIESVIEAKTARVAEPILVGDAGRIRDILRAMGRNPSDFYIVGTASGQDDAQTAVELIREGSADF